MRPTRPLHLWRFLSALTALCPLAGVQNLALYAGFESSGLTNVLIANEESAALAARAVFAASSRLACVNIIGGPGIAQARCARPVNLVDLYPTLAELCGFKAPAQLDGVSLAPLLADPAAPWAHASLTTHGHGNHAVRDERWRYIRYADGSEELYDHDADPNEWRNLAGRPDKAEIKARLAAHMPEVDHPPVPHAKGTCQTG